MKKINFIILILFITFFLGSCKDKDTLEWTNEECVEAYVRLEDRERILNNIDDYFSDLDYKKLYVIRKTPYDDMGLILLFILNDVNNKEDFKRQLKEKGSFWVGNYDDVPFESYDNRYIYAPKTTIKVGEKVSLSIEGERDHYTKTVNFNEIYIVLKKDVGFYNFKEFGKLGVRFVDREKNSYLLILKEDNYFNQIKVLDKICRTNNDAFEKVSTYWRLPVTDSFTQHTYWRIINDDVGTLTVNQVTDEVIFEGKSKGTAIVWYQNLSIEITVV